MQVFLSSQSYNICKKSFRVLISGKLLLSGCYENGQYSKIREVCSMAAFSRSLIASVAGIGLLLVFFILFHLGGITWEIRN
jgi:hypothetical protein